MINVKVGDTVWIAPYHGKAFPTTVTKVARVWITAGEGHAARKFRLDDQTDGNRDFPTRFYTGQQWAELERTREVSAFLHAQGIVVRPESPPSRAATNAWGADMLRTDDRALRVYRDAHDKTGTVLCPRHRDHLFKLNPSAYGCGEYGGDCEQCPASAYTNTETAYGRTTVHPHAIQVF